MELFLYSFLSFWLGWLVYRRTYNIRLQRAVDVHRAVMDQAYELLSSDEDKLSILTFCSDIKVLEESVNATGALKLVAEKIRESRGLLWSQAC